MPDGIIVGVGASGTVNSASGNKIYGATIGTVASNVLVPNPSRKSIVFHNPGTQAVYVGPFNQVSYVTFKLVPLPLTVACAGSFMILPGGFLTLSGEIQDGWQAIVAANTNPLTVMESNI